MVSGLRFDYLKFQSPEEYEKVEEFLKYGLGLWANQVKMKIKTFIP